MLSGCKGDFGCKVSLFVSRFRAGGKAANDINPFGFMIYASHMIYAMRTIYPAGYKEIYYQYRTLCGIS